MIRSMTGYGKSTGTYGSKQITVELKSLNSKQFDLSLKSPPSYSDFESEIRNALNLQLERGKVYCSVTVENPSGEQTLSLNIPLMKACYQQLRELESALGLPPAADYLSVMMRMPDALKGSRGDIEPDEMLVLKNVLHEAIRELDLFRHKEGEELEKDFVKRIQKIGTLLASVEPYENERIVRQREKITRELNEGMVQGYDLNRFEQEMIYYLEKLDITEEKVRLKNHLDHFGEVIRDEAGSGRKLGFIAQEIGREINTIGSKANDAAIQRIVVDMKDELEKIKEQLLNIL